MTSYKTNNGIVDLRVDDRMVHGIVAAEWLPDAKATRVMVINDAASKSDILRSTLKMATPGGTALSVLAPEKAIQNFKDGKYVNQRVFVIAREISDAYELFKAGVDFKRINLGNVTQNQGADLTVLDKTVRVTHAELNQLKEMKEQGILVTCQFRVKDSMKICSEL